MKIKVFCQGYGSSKMTAEQLRNSLSINDRWDLVDCDINPDLVVIHSSEINYCGFYDQIFSLRKKWGEKCFILWITGESVDCEFVGADYSISYKPDGPQNYYKIHWVNAKIISELVSASLPQVIIKNRDKPKKYFCNFIYSKPERKRFPGVATRNEFCKLLSTYKKVDCAGRSLNNTDRLKLMEQGGGNAKINFMSDYKFSIAFENQSREGYITEKIWDAYQAGTIPIYYGSNNITDFFNAKSFVNCHDYSSFEEVIDRVIEIDNDPQLFNQYLNANPLSNNSRIYDFTGDKASIRSDTIMEAVSAKMQKFNHLNQKGHARAHSILFWAKFIGLHPIGVLFILRKMLKISIQKLIKRALS